MKLSASQKSICERVLNAFETGSAEGDYSKVTIYADGPNNVLQVTYGRSQTTEYGKLRDLIGRYAAANGVYSSQIAPYVPNIGRVSLVRDTVFLGLLKSAGKHDPVMRRTQDVFFDERYFSPARRWAEKNGFTTALAMLVIYDSFIHSGTILDFLRARFSERPPAAGGDEKTWIRQYVEVRHRWLANHSRPILRKTIYRTACFKREIDRNNWDLAQLPIDANGVKIHPAADLATASAIHVPKSLPEDPAVPFLGSLPKTATKAVEVPGFEPGTASTNVADTSASMVTGIRFEMDLGSGDELRLGTLTVMGEKKTVFMLADATSGKRGRQDIGFLWSVSQGPIPALDGLKVLTEEVDPESDSQTGPRFRITPDWLTDPSTHSERGGFSIRGTASLDGTGGSIALRNPGEFDFFRQLMAGAASAGIKEVPLQVKYTGDWAGMKIKAAKKLGAVFSMRLEKSDTMLYGILTVTGNDGKEIFYAKATSGKRGHQHPKEFWTKGIGVVPPTKDARSIETKVWATDPPMGTRFRILPETVRSADGKHSRSAFRVHIDSNAPGSAGCIVFPSKADMDRFIALCAALRQKGVDSIPLELDYT